MDAKEAHLIASRHLEYSTTFIDMSKVIIVISIDTQHYYCVVILKGLNHYVFFWSSRAKMAATKNFYDFISLATMRNVLADSQVSKKNEIENFCFVLFFLLIFFSSPSESLFNEMFWQIKIQL